MNIAMIYIAMIYVEKQGASFLIAVLLIAYILIAVLAERQIVIWQKVLIFCLSNGADTRI